jgi:propionyl-CoA carboxylase beta chain
MTDFVLMVEGTSYMHITGPDVVKAATHEEVTSEGLAARTCTRRSPASRTS